MQNIKVRNLQPDEFELWDRLNHSSLQGSIFLRSDFLQMLCNTDSNFNQVMLLGCFNESGELKSGQAVIFHKSGFSVTGHGSYFFYNGPLLQYEENEPRASMAATYCSYLTPLAEETARRFPGFSFDTHPHLMDLRVFQRLGWQVELRYTHQWKIGQSRDMRPYMRQGERKRIHRAERNFIFQMEKWQDSGQEFIQTHQESIRRHGWNPDERWNRLLSDRAQWMEDHGIFQMTTARTLQRQLVGGILTILGYTEKTAYLWFVGYQAEAAENGVVPALYDQAVRNIPAGILVVDMGKAEKIGLANFKDYLGTDLLPYYTVISPNRFQMYKKKIMAVGKASLREIKPIFKSRT